ncbi:MAG: preprotein translocase subunit SecA, partial [Candidatus Omnitrophica bacterium]|nr:preprotein translocase subunit SecA [Candidatus Omnitrophota bacterium]
MVGFILRKIFGDANERELKRLKPIVERINQLEPKIESLCNEEILAKTEGFRDYIRKRKQEFNVQELEPSLQRKKEEEILEEILPEAFALVREAGRRTIGLRHFDVQLVGGIVLHRGKIAEMATGEGKTLVATLAVYLNALLGRGVHVV